MLVCLDLLIIDAHQIFNNLLAILYFVHSTALSFFFFFLKKMLMAEMIHGTEILLAVEVDKVMLHSDLSPTMLHSPHLQYHLR